MYRDVRRYTDGANDEHQRSPSGPSSWSRMYGPAGPIAEVAAGDAFDADVLIYAAAPDHELATAFGATYGLRAADAIHLATAVNAGAGRFITNNRAAFSKSIAEIAVTYPEGRI